MKLPKPTVHTDSERLNFLLQFLSIEDVGDDSYAPGIVVNMDRMEEKVGLGAYDPNLCGTNHGGNPCLCEFGDDLRVVLDRAIDAHGMPQEKLDDSTGGS